MIDMENILVIAPHNDDEILGCGGVMSKYIKQGKNVYVIVVTNGHLGAPELFSKEGTEKVRSEALKAHTFLGVKKTIFLDFPAVNLDALPAYKLSLAISKVISEFQIDTLYIPHRGDIHKDHRITYEAALVAGRPINNSTVKRIYAYETLSETEWAAPFGDDVFIPTVFINIKNEIDDKLKAFAFFSTQIKKFPHSRSPEIIRTLSNYRGATVGCANAEAFMLIRSIED
jgi:LmbE family N-acetylglucosaminyl deacetylase